VYITLLSLGLQRLELVRTKTPVKGAIIHQWYESHYAQPVSKKFAAKAGGGGGGGETAEEKKQSRHVERKLEARKKDAEIDALHFAGLANHVLREQNQTIFNLDNSLRCFC